MLRSELQNMDSRLQKMLNFVNTHLLRKKGLISNLLHCFL